LKSIEPTIKRDYSDNISKGERLFEAGKIEEAIQCFEGILVKNLRNAEALNNLGVISYAIGDFESAEKFLLKTLSINPNHIRALINIADVYRQSGRFNDAARHLTTAIELESKNPEIWECLSNFYKDIGDHEQAQTARNNSTMLKQGSTQ